MRKFKEWATLERGLAFGATAFCCGSLLLGAAVNQWRVAGFGDLDYAATMRWVIPGVTLAMLGCQTVFSSFMLSILRMARK
jgi:hypothetical protein